MRCTACHATIPESHRFCGACGTPVPPPSEIPTITAMSSIAVGRTAGGPFLAGTVSGDAAAGFTPGSLFAGRYRIAGLLGRGGMGEVYRADDLKLGQPVALKFLPRDVADDPGRLDRLLAEVRMARQVSHPNVCRVYDVADHEGRPFLSMEYVDGEDLHSLLQRIGRLPPDKALDIARQIAAGLAAAHDRGVLHRDLKPANVMLDGRGRIRLTDFGLAVSADSAAGPAAAGTPAYMAPEQLAGHAASIQSDIYALGLVLFELYTGRRAFTATSFPELFSQKEHGAVPAPSEYIPDMDPVVERVILRAIAPDPRARPASVAQVIAALPGGGLLEAVLRAGETPSPEMVAASGPEAGIRPPLAWTLFVLTMLGAAAAVATTARAPGVLWREAAAGKSPEVMADHARQMLAGLGYRHEPADVAWGFEVDLDQLAFHQALHPTRWRIEKPAVGFLRFWYREGPQPLEAWRFPFQYGNATRVTPADPPLVIAGMALVRLDSSGHLTRLVVVPSGSAETGGPPTVDWNAVLTAAGFDPAAWTPVPSARTPPVYGDVRAAWEGLWPNTRDLRVRLEAAAFRGRLVYFDAVHPWTPPPLSASTALTSTQRSALAAAVFVFGITVMATAVAAQRNVRAGRGDRRGAFRLSVFVGAAMLVSWFFGESHVATMWEIGLVVMALSWACLCAGVSWLAYLAAEPFLRRRWPEVLVSWTRLLSGEFRDPLVGRDALIGCLAGPLLAVVAVCGTMLPERVGYTSDLVFADLYGVAFDVQAVVALLVWRAAQGVLAALACVFLLLMLRQALRSPAAAALALIAGGGAIAGAGAVHFWIGFANTAALLAVFVLLLTRFGLLAAVVQFYTWGLFIFFPATTHLDGWYAGAGVTALLVFVALAVFGFTTSLGGRPAFGASRPP